MRTDGRTDITELTVDLRNFVNVPKNSVRTSQKHSKSQLLQTVNAVYTEYNMRYVGTV